MGRLCVAHQRNYELVFGLYYQGCIYGVSEWYNYCQISVDRLLFHSTKSLLLYWIPFMSSFQTRYGYRSLVDYMDARLDYQYM